jgi:hypothetical protein
MDKRAWISGFFFIAFALTLAHSSIPHTHPESTKKKHVSDVNSDHQKHQESHKHSHNHSDNKHNESNESLPVFYHFANADFLGGQIFKFNLAGDHVLELLEPMTFLLQVPQLLLKPLLFPRARDLPADKPRSTESLRAPPFFS